MGTPPVQTPVDESDIIRFTPTQLGTNTAGTFTWYFDGSDVDLTAGAEDVDALAVLDNGGSIQLVLSTAGNPTVTGLSGARDEDLLLFTPTPTQPLGDDSTAGTWSFYFDGSDVGLSEASSEDVNGVWIDPANGELYLTTVGVFNVTGLSGDGADIFICDPGSPPPPSATTTCTFRPYWDGSANGFAGEVVDAFVIEQGGTAQAASASVAGSPDTQHAGEGDDPLADPDEGADDVFESDQEHQLFLPLMQQ
jgi:hypothetical protein